MLTIEHKELICYNYKFPDYKLTLSVKKTPFQEGSIKDIVSTIVIESSYGGQYLMETSSFVGGFNIEYTIKHLLSNMSKNIRKITL